MAALTSAPLWLFACSWIIVHCEDTKEVTVKPGEDVPLQCRGPRGANITLIEWSRPDLGSDQYVFLFRDGHLNENYLLPSFRGRVELRDPEMKDGDTSVVLKNVITNDTGTYECQVSAGSNRRRKRAIETFSIITLTVTDPDPDPHSDPDPGLTAAQKEEGNKEGGNKEGGNKDSVGVRAGVPVAVLLLVVGVVVGLIFRRRRGRTEKNSHQPAETESLRQQV